MQLRYGRSVPVSAGGETPTANAFLKRHSDKAVPNTNPRILILVVEDEPLVRMDLSDFLRDAGFDVLEAGNGDEAVRILELHDEVRLVVTDVDMPGSMDGLKLARAVADRWPPVRIIVVSGHRLVERGDIPDGSLFFPKPYRQAQLLASMHELLG